MSDIARGIEAIIDLKARAKELEAALRMLFEECRQGRSPTLGQMNTVRRVLGVIQADGSADT